MKQKFQVNKIFLILIGFVGITLILKPVFNDNLLAGLMGVLSGFGAAIAYIMVAKLGKLKEAGLRTVFYFTFLSTVLSFALMLTQNIHPISFYKNLLFLLILGFSATIAQLAVTQAYKEGKTINNAAYSYMTVVFSVIWGILIFREELATETILGIILIFISGFFVSKK